MITALVNGRILTDDGFVDGRAALLEGGRIKAIADEGDARNAESVHDLDGRVLLPGFIDAQVNGGGGVLFNDDPSVDAIVEIGRVHRRFGTTGFLPTLISDDLATVARAVDAARGAIEKGVPGVLGIHIEGPFLNAKRRGVHDASKLRSLDERALGLLTSLKSGTTVVTLAPEMTTPEIIRKLSNAGVIVSAGHSNATYAEVRVAIEHGLTGFTHLFNAMSQLTGREPGVVGAALDDPNTWCGIILDGRHVDPVVLRIALRSKRQDRFMLVTDAMPSVGTGQLVFNLQGRKIMVDGYACIDEEGRLAGTHLDMAASVRNARAMLEIDTIGAVRMATLHPAAFLRLDHELGRIAPGYRANFVVTDSALNVTETWIDGRRYGHSD